MATFYKYAEEKKHNGEVVYTVLVSNNELFYPQARVVFDSEQEALGFMHECKEND